MKYRYALAIALAAIAATACSKNSDKSDPVMATVNGEAITTKEFESMVTMMSNGQITADKLNPDQKKMVMDRLVVVHVAAADAVKSGLDKQAETVGTLKMMRLNVLSSAAIKNYMDKITVPDSEIQAEYATKYGQASKEFKASHILVKTEEEANGLIAQLKKGADFAELAKKHSTDPGSGKSGGDLGWFKHGAMVPEFTAAVETLEKGKITDKPVQSQYGFHIIKLEDTRDAAPPALDTVKSQIESGLKQQKFQKYLEDLKNNAKVVEVKNESSSSSTSSASSSVSSAAK